MDNLQKIKAIENQIKQVEKEWEDWHKANNGTTGYSYPYWQVKALKEKLNSLIK